MELKRIIAYDVNKFNFNMDKIWGNTRKIYLLLSETDVTFMEI